MRAITVEKVGGPEVLKCMDIPEPPVGPSDILVKVSTAGVNFIDVYYRTGLYQHALPFTVGFEGAGTVTGVGADVKEFHIGDRVTWPLALGSYAEYIVLPEEKAIRIPDGVDDATAAASMVQGTTAHYLTHDTYPIEKGDVVLVHAAAGGTGLLITQMAKWRGARVIATVSTEQKAQLAREAGADDVIIYSRQDFAAEVTRLTDGRGVDCVYDSVGKATFDKSLACLRPCGTMVVCGTSSGPVPPFDIQRLSVLGSLYLTRPNGFTHTATRDKLLTHANAVLDGILAKRLSIRINHSYALEDASTAHTELESRMTTGKLLLFP